ncbi:MAG TPA: hypothetical protein VIQ62_10205 [Burkholderiales bacterium]
MSSVMEGGDHVTDKYWYCYRDRAAGWMATQPGVAKDHHGNHWSS